MEIFFDHGLLIKQLFLMDNFITLLDMLKIIPNHQQFLMVVVLKNGKIYQIHQQRLNQLIVYSDIHHQKSLLYRITTIANVRRKLCELFNRFSPDFTGFYRILPDFTGFLPILNHSKTLYRKMNTVKTRSLL